VEEKKYIEIAGAIIEAARVEGYLNGPVSVIPELAEPEKAFFILMLEEVRKHLTENKTSDLSADEIVSMFTYVFARAGEAVSCWTAGEKVEFEKHGMFDGKIPMYSDEKLMQYFKQTTFPSDLANAFARWNEKNSDFCQDNEIDPILPLFEALKWTWRLTVNFTIEYLEEHHGMEF